MGNRPQGPASPRKGALACGQRWFGYCYKGAGSISHLESLQAHSFCGLTTCVLGAGRRGRIRDGPQGQMVWHHCRRQDPAQVRCSGRGRLQVSNQLQMQSALVRSVIRVSVLLSYCHLPLQHVHDFRWPPRLFFHGSVVTLCCMHCLTNHSLNRHR